MTIFEISDLIELNDECEANLYTFKKEVEKLSVGEIHHPLLNLCKQMYQKLLELNEKINQNMRYLESIPIELSSNRNSFVKELDKIMLKAYRMRCSDITHVPVDWFNMQNDPRRPFPLYSKVCLSKFGQYSVPKTTRMKLQFITPCDDCQKLKSIYKIKSKSPNNLKSLNENLYQRLLNKKDVNENIIDQGIKSKI